MCSVCRKLFTETFDTIAPGWLILEQMSRSNLIKTLAGKFGQLTLHDVDSVVPTILEAMNSALVRGHRIEVRGFGSFSAYTAPPESGAIREVVLK